MGAGGGVSISTVSDLAFIDRIVSDLAARGSALVAFSGGVDSAVVAALAWRAVGERAAEAVLLTQRERR